MFLSDNDRSFYPKNDEYNEIKTILSMVLLDTQLLLFIMEFVHEFTKNDRVTVIHLCRVHDSF